MKTRIRMHQFPGDLPRQNKVAMLEGRDTRSGVKTWKKCILSRERTVLRERTRVEVQDQLDA